MKQKSDSKNYSTDNEMISKKRKRSIEKDNIKQDDFIVINDASNLNEEDQLKCIFLHYF